MKPQTLPRIDVEPELSRAIRSMGGQRVDELLGKKPGISNADFCFSQQRVIAELKCLEVDQLSNDEFVKKTSAIHAKYVSSGQIKQLVAGRRRITTDGLPEEMKLEIARLYATPIIRAIKKAHMQIEQTAERLKDMGPWRGLLILVNNGNTALDPEHIRWSLAECFSTTALPSIHHVIAFTVNLPSKATYLGMDVHAWISAGVRKEGEKLHEFARDLHDAWCKHLSNITGAVASIDASWDAIDGLKNKP